MAAHSRELALNRCLELDRRLAGCRQRRNVGLQSAHSRRLALLGVWRASLVKESLAERTRAIAARAAVRPPVTAVDSSREPNGRGFSRHRPFFRLATLALPQTQSRRMGGPRGPHVLRRLRARPAPAQAPGCELGLPRHTDVSRQRYRWLCAYYDAQVTFPERLTLSMLTDAAELASQAGLDSRCCRITSQSCWINGLKSRGAVRESQHACSPT